MSGISVCTEKLLSRCPKSAPVPLVFRFTFLVADATFAAAASGEGAVAGLAELDEGLDELAGIGLLGGDDGTDVPPTFPAS